MAHERSTDFFKLTGEDILKKPPAYTGEQDRPALPVDEEKLAQRNTLEWLKLYWNLSSEALKETFSQFDLDIREPEDLLELARMQEEGITENGYEGQSGTIHAFDTVDVIRLAINRLPEISQKDIERATGRTYSPQEVRAALKGMTQ